MHKRPKPNRSVIYSAIFFIIRIQTTAGIIFPSFYNFITRQNEKKKNNMSKNIISEMWLTAVSYAR